MKSEREPFFGVILILGVFGLYVNSALRAVTDHPNWIGAVFVICNLICGCLVCVSVYRDRVA